MDDTQKRVRQKEAPIAPSDAGFPDRLRAFRGKITQSDFARMAGTKQQMLSRWEKGECWPSAENLFLLSSATGKSIDWLLTGKEEAQKPLPELTLQATPRFKTYAEKTRLSMEQYVPIRLLKDEVAAGLPTEIRETDVDGWVLIYASKEWMPHDPAKYTCAHIRGYSMSPILEPGDIIAIDHAEKDPENLHNKMVVFRDNGGVTVKWLRHIPEHRLIIGEPENKDEAASALYFVGDEINGKIVGKVAWWWGKR